MKLVSVKSLTGQEILAQPVISSNGSVMMFDGIVIRSEFINKLKDMGIETVYIREEEDKAEQIDSLDINDMDIEDIRNVKEIIDRHISGQMEIGKDIGKFASEIVIKVLNEPHIHDCMTVVKKNSFDLYAHLVNVAILSTIMGYKLGFTPEELDEMAKGAVLHDIGLVKVDIRYENVEMDKMPATDKYEYRNHVLKGFEVVKKADWLSNQSKAIILLHHERSDGSGYPFQKNDKDIGKLVKLVSICDHFDELVNGIGYKSRKVHEVVEYFRTKGTYLFDFDMLAKVIINIAWFPTGCKVITNEGEIGVVIRQNKGLPDRPVIKMITRCDGKSYVTETIKDLTKILTIFIVDTIDD